MGYPKIPDIKCEDIEKIYKEEDEWRKTNPCCSNCKCFYQEYGDDLCTKHDYSYPEPDNFKCEDWR